jgi:hypothetical protein
VEGFGDDQQTRFGAGVAAARCKHRRLEQQPAVAAAVVEFGKYVEAVHSEDAKDTPSRPSVRSAASTPR